MESNNGNIHSNPSLSQFEALLDLRRQSLLGQSGHSQPLSNGFHQQLQRIQEPNYVPGLNQPQPLRLTVRPDEIMYSPGEIRQQTPIDDDSPELFGAIQNAWTHIQQSGSENVSARITYPGIWMSIALHRSLAGEGLTRPLTLEHVREQGRTEMVTVEIEQSTADGSGSSVSVAIAFFPGLLEQQQHARCVACNTDTEFSPDQQRWNRATEGFGKQWISGLLKFPLRSELPECDHSLRLCRACMGEYIETQMRVLGRGAPDKIKCPEPRCKHRLTLEEVGRFASAATCRRYEELCTLKMLSKSPDFRWCLREGCGSGGFYDNAGLPLRSASRLPCFPCPPGCITCPECEMAMCYICQVPWHQGLTCQEFWERRAEREQWRATEEWERINTKECPGEGCGVRICADGGCSQVHCKECATDFCSGCRIERGRGHGPRCKAQRLLDRVSKRQAAHMRDIVDIEEEDSETPG
ncbi:hypothetical protein F4680DRAFT_410964 [Xylaria scruposa]|nr:hypothetical protein F4680DRAFT_410964 [Xylaria scruposa]